MYQRSPNKSVIWIESILNKKRDNNKMKVLRNISWIFVANLIASLTKWLILVIIARILTPEDVGAYSLALAVSAPITLFANMKLRSLYITNQKYYFGDYLYSRNLLSVLAFIVLFTITLVVYPNQFYIILLVGLIKICDLQSDIFYSVPHKNENMKLIGKLLIGKHLNSLVFFLITLYYTTDLTTALLIQFAFQILYLLFVEKRLITNKYSLSNHGFNKHSIKNIILTGIPLGFVQMLFSLNSSYPRYLLEYFESAETLGYFSAIAYIVTVGNLLMNAVSQNFLPNLARLISNKKYSSFERTLFINLTITSIILGGSIILFSFIFGGTFLEIFYGVEYADYTDILILMSIAVAINFISWNFDTALLAMRYISIQPKISVIVLIVNLILGYLLIKQYGIYGATYTIIITNCLQLILRVIFVSIKLRQLSKND